MKNRRLKSSDTTQSTPSSFVTGLTVKIHFENLVGQLVVTFCTSLPCCIWLLFSSLRVRLVLRCVAVVPCHPNPCESGPCHNFAVCSGNPWHGTYVCVCLPTYYGTNCGYKHRKL